MFHVSAVIGHDSILFVDDFSITKVPSSNGKKYYISSPATQGMSFIHSPLARSIVRTCGDIGGKDLEASVVRLWGEMGSFQFAPLCPSDGASYRSQH